MSNFTSQETAYVIEDDQQAINAAYQLADFALIERNHRDQQQALPHDVIAQFSLKGLAGIRIPKQYGGAYVSNQTLALVFKIIAKADASVGQIPQNQFGLLNSLARIAPEAQKQWLYAEILKGKRLANAGPERYTLDSRSISSHLIRQNQDYVLSGTKFYSTGASFADYRAVVELRWSAVVMQKRLTVLAAQANL